MGYKQKSDQEYQREYYLKRKQRPEYKEYLKTDITLREYLEKKMRGFYVASIEIERNDKSVRVIIKTARPGM